MSPVRNSKIRTLGRAVEAFGGANNLATHFEIELSQLEDWIAGRVEIPPEVFGAALDVVAAGPFARWSGDGDASFAERDQARADRLQQIAQRIKASAERAQRIADQAQRSADRSTALAQVQRVMTNARGEQDSDRPAKPPSAKLVGEKGTDK